MACGLLIFRIIQRETKIDAGVKDNCDVGRRKNSVGISCTWEWVLVSKVVVLENFETVVLKEKKVFRFKHNRYFILFRLNF